MRTLDLTLKQPLLALALASLVALTACGDDDEDNGGGGNNTANNTANNPDNNVNNPDNNVNNPDNNVNNPDNNVNNPDNNVNNPQPQTIAEIVVGSEDFETLEAAVIQAGLADELGGEGPFTVFAPTDDAFAALLDALGATPEELLARPDLADILLYHATPGRLDSGAVVDAGTLTMLNGDEVTITVEGDTVKINDATITMVDIQASNGVIHVIDSVLIPPADEPDPQTITDIVVGSDDFEVLEAAVIEAGLADDLAGEGPFTVFAPTDDAFAALLDALGTDAAGLLANPDLANILLYHVFSGSLDSGAVVDSNLLRMLGGGYSVITVEGEAVRINDALITTVDIQASNGIIHVIDAVILPPGTITEIVVGNDDFETLEAAVIEAELADDLAGEGPFTVFAPTDAAFAALLNALGTDAAGLLANPDLADILLYHVVSGAFGSSDVVELDFAETLLGADIDITVTPAGVRVNDANIVIVDIPAANGVIHVIDAVLLPPAN
jgi:uncharacterized surface protein with fasciclin (FAS1) repeats